MGGAYNARFVVTIRIFYNGLCVTELSHICVNILLFPRLRIDMTASTIRQLVPADIDALMTLERRQWSGEQLPSEETLLARIHSHPRWCLGVFCTISGDALASAFLIPINAADMHKAKSWGYCTQLAIEGSAPMNALFGVSLTSIDPEAGRAIFEHLLPRALKAGFTEVYLGSPIPGFARAKARNGDLTAEQYVRKKRRCGKRPADPQLFYYYNHGCHDIIRVCEDYFPHKASLDYGVIVRGYLPLSEFIFIWRRLPLPVLLALSGLLFSLLRIPRKPPRFRSPLEVTG